MTDTRDITVLGAGITGLWAALTLARRGHRVALHERTADPFADAASRYAGAMLAPFCEQEDTEPIVVELGKRGLEIWRETCPHVVANGSLVVATARDGEQLDRFARMTEAHTRADRTRIADLEPDLGGRFARGLFYHQEAHVAPIAAMQYVLDEAQAAGATVRFGCDAVPDTGHVIDCRGIAARDGLPTLRGVRGERAIIRTAEVRLSRPVRLLHPRFPLYVVPWGGGRFMVGATVIERDDTGPMTVRSALELLSAAYAIHPAFGEADILDFGAHVRPAFPDNVPRIVRTPDRTYMNGLYRHGFLLAPVMAEMVADWIETGTTRAEVFVEDLSERRGDGDARAHA